MKGEVESSELLCSTCGQTTLQEITYAGRLITSVRCTHCGTVVRFDRPSLPAEYKDDLRERLRSKPRRFAHRLRRHPLKALRSLPAAIVRQPMKLFVEWKTVRAERRARGR